MIVKQRSIFDRKKCKTYTRQDRYALTKDSLAGKVKNRDAACLLFYNFSWAMTSLYWAWSLIVQDVKMACDSGMRDSHPLPDTELW